MNGKVLKKLLRIRPYFALLKLITASIKPPASRKAPTPSPSKEFEINTPPGGLNRGFTVCVTAVKLL